ncbi:MAG: hypothetical protein NC928_01710 [Candidatus Omnitrophica bacterium]|nr:hypothetical protein [Candidatus Omnitrophota bacterium]
MIVLIILIFLIGMGLTAYALFSSGLSRTQKKTKKVFMSVSEDAREQEIVAKEQKILRLEEKIKSLEEELENSRLEGTNIQQELENSKAAEARLKEELKRREEWVAESEAELKKTKDRSLELETQFKELQEQLAEEFNKAVELNQQLAQAKERLQTLDKENKEKTDTIESLRHQIEGYLKQVKYYQQIAEELKRKEEISEWVPKTEFNQLNEEYTLLEKELEAKEEYIEKLKQEVIRLNNQLREKPQGGLDGSEHSHKNTP